MSDSKTFWTVLDRTILYANPWITICEDHVCQPDGKEAAWGIFEMKPGGLRPTHLMTTATSTQSASVAIPSAVTAAW